MTEKILEPGSILGVLGGGQLGAMFAGAARRMGYEVAVWDPDPDAPAHRGVRHSFVAPFSDIPTREKFSDIVHAVTFEWENVPASLCEWLEQHHRVRPGSAVLRIIQDRIEQKQFLQSRHLPVPSFTTIESPNRLTEAVKAIGVPGICKTAMTGYDGKGQWIIRQASDVVSQTMKDVAAIANKTSTEANQVSSSFEQLRHVAQSLQSSVDQFKVS